MASKFYLNINNTLGSFTRERFFKIVKNLINTFGLL